MHRQPAPASQRGVVSQVAEAYGWCRCNQKMDCDKRRKETQLSVLQVITRSLSKVVRTERSDKRVEVMLHITC